jgi:hypothetical protein
MRNDAMEIAIFGVAFGKNTCGIARRDLAGKVPITGNYRASAASRRSKGQNSRLQRRTRLGTRAKRRSLNKISAKRN